jgi:hypothetical protein
MKGGTLAADVKRTSVLRRVPPLGSLRFRRLPAVEGDVCAFALPADAAPLIVEACSGRAMTLAPGDVFLGTPAHRESTRWVVGDIPAGGLVPGRTYWMLADSGLVGALIGDSPREKIHLGQVKYLGAVSGGDAVSNGDGRTLNIRQFAARVDGGFADHGAPVILLLGTSAEVGKTTAGIAVLRALRKRKPRTVVALKATGTSSLTELNTYLDFGAARAFDCVDVGLPTTYPSGRKGIARPFDQALENCLSLPAEAVLVECGGDMLGANVPVFLERLKRRRPRPKIILAAADAFGALGAKRMLAEMGLKVTLITGPCTDTPTLKRRVEDLCGVPATNATRDEIEDGVLLS